MLLKSIKLYVNIGNQSSKRHDRSESLKLEEYIWNSKNIVTFFFDSHLTGLIQNEQNILQYLSIYKTHGVYS